MKEMEQRIVKLETVAKCKRKASRGRVEVIFKLHNPNKKRVSTSRGPENKCASPLPKMLSCQIRGPGVVSGGRNLSLSLSLSN